ncbi:cell division protein FtsZ [Rhodobacter xanthinilyticus]|uniref:Cell division protein FtsZ n=1 Tax=Rhodobacter xanthinilyticus TaxID=1850250 RepID=A0A1D9MD44_9RHOB|nr:cell division protein FtsZ [Rhodobacter xanthinilyticus]AOZ69795.1 cell division protein FtsZ [Rhodobacter xanthinilyticus]
MTLNLMMSDHEDLKPRITVFGVGGAGGNAVNNMIEKELDGVEFVVANTDAQALQQSRSQARIQMGVKVTEGLGAGAKPTIGAAAAEESIESIVDHLAGAHMCFITAGMGGGTGTGAAPIIAQAARELGVLTVGVVTKPFQFEGPKRMRQAEAGIEALQKVVDTLIIIPNQNLFRLASERTTFTEAFAMADDVLYQGVKGVTDLMVRPGLINLDFADVRSVMDEMGKAMMGTGEATGDDRALQAAEKAIANPLLDEISLKGAKGVLINITGGYDLTLFELDEAANRIREEVDPDANIIVGSTLDPNMEGVMRVSVVATGIDAVVSHVETPVARRPMAEPLKAPEAPRQPALTVTAAQPVAAAPQPAPQQPAPQPMAERNLFEAAAPAPQAPVRAEAEDLPPPAYQPRAAAPAPRDLHVEDDAGAFVAPRPRAPGTPSPEALARLQAAVNKVPAQQAAPQPHQAAPRAAMAASRPAAPQPAPEKPRFGINSLINRMTGHAAEAPAPAPRATHAAAQQAPQHQAYDEEQDGDQDRIEIPAFLRRQAN